MRNSIYKVRVRKTARCLAVSCLLLFFGIGHTFAQGNDQQFVIKKGNHYLAHVKNSNGVWEIQDATTFSPNCLWYSGREFSISGTNHNYYFIDDNGTPLDGDDDVPHFLAAPLEANGLPYLSASAPETYLLSNPDTDYYFYDWDNDGFGRGVSRGHQYAGVGSSEECTSCGGDWYADECWKVHWIGYDGGWKMSNASTYDLPEDFAARFRLVTVESFPMVINSEGGLEDLASFEMEFEEPYSHDLSATISPFNYIPTYKKYDFNEPGSVHHTYYYPYGSTNTAPPTAVSSGENPSASYQWSISGEGAEYLSFSETGTYTHTSTSAAPTVYYRTQNNSGHKTATLTLTVTYQDGSAQTKTAMVTVKTTCQNPSFSANVTFNDVIVSWTPTAESYTVSWKKTDATEWSSHEVTSGDVTSYTLTGLDYETTYDYKVKASCTSTEPDALQFTTLNQPTAVIGGAVFGGGRMANVNGKTEVVIINTDSIRAVYGGNDIFGTVGGAEGSSIKLGVTDTDPDAVTYNNGQASSKVRIGDVYGGGNGYYLYDATTFAGATDAEITLENNDVVTDLDGNTVYTNTSGADQAKTIPSITKTSITVNHDAVKVDSIFGGAKNAFLTANGGSSSSITVNAGTAFAVFGGNNFGGLSGVGTSKHSIVVNGTKAKTSVNDYNASQTGRDFGIRYLFGGGNKVAALESDILIAGGQCDTVFAGGNSADVIAAKATVQCSVTAGSGVTFGSSYSDAIGSTDGSSITVKDDYAWNGTGIYNVRTLFGGNNKADMTGVPTITLTSGSVGTVYGGGNAGDMLAQVLDDGTIATDFGSPMLDGTPDPEPQDISFGTHVVMNSATMLVDYLYGGCQMSDVEYSTWVEIQDGHVGTVYGGCNISGDVGSEPRYSFSNGMPDDKYQMVKGATYVKASGGTVHGNLFAGANGFYHCNNGLEYISGLNFGEPPYDPDDLYVGDTIPTHNETHVMVSGTATIKGNVYAGGNMAYVGFITATDQNYRFRDFVGLASVTMDGGTVEGDVYGGGNRASIFGSNEMRISGGHILGALYGGNDRAGQVAQISNRYMFGEYSLASDGFTSLPAMGVKTYVHVTGKPQIHTVYGGGNGAYTYDPDEYCDITDQPVQATTFVDINIDGSDNNPATQAHIDNVFGGGNGVTVTGGITVLLNVINPENYDHVGNIFGGNNQGDLSILPNIILLNGQVNTVYGGCNQGAMTGSYNFAGYPNISSRVHLSDTYTPAGTSTPKPLFGVVSGAVYGGCRMNGVTNNSIVLVEGGNHPNASMFGGSDISGAIGGTSQVVVTGGQVGSVYGGGNGGYIYDNNQVYSLENELIAEDLDGNLITAPISSTSQVDILGGQVGSTSANRSVFGGGYGQETQTIGNVTVNIGNLNAASASATPTIFGDVYGGSALGTVNTNATDLTTVNFFNGTLYGNVYGGGLGAAILNDNGYIDTTEPVVEALVNGTVQVNIGEPAQTSNFVNIDGSVFGGNNLAGTPLANVYVDVYRTAHTSANTYPSSIPDPLTEAFFDNAAYALYAVYGGGNLAHYVPTSTDAATYVHIHNCDNTIQYVYGGGNAANVPTNEVTIDGGLVKYVFGGGNGAGTGNPGANVNGDNTLNLDGGVIGYVFGGSNTKGAVTGVTNLLFTETPSCSLRSINELYGGGNQAPDVDGITLNVPCGTSGVNVIYGGSRMADVGTSEAPADIVVNVNGGELDAIYGGNNISGTIYGNVTLNLYGGTIDKAFGGNNAGGDILGNIQVNVLDTSTDCPLNLNTVYGGGNMAAYTPANASAASPEVNVIHGTVNDAVYGGGMGNAAQVTANPIVTIGDDVVAHKAIVGSTLIGTSTQGSGNVYGGGDAAAVIGTTTVIYQDTHNESQVKNLFGGGNQANASGTTINMNNGTVLTCIYGGCNTAGTVTGDISVNLNGGSVAQDVFGGGMGNATATQGNVMVTIDGSTISRDVYGGSALGQVNDNGTDDLTKVWLKDGTITGNLYGGGMGKNGQPTYGQVNGKVEVLVNGGTVDNVFGCNNLNGAPQSSVQVDIDETTSGTMDIGGNVYGGGNQATYGVTGNNYPVVNLLKGTLTHDVFGGGLGDASDATKGVVTGNPQVIVNGDDMSVTGGIYGGGSLAPTIGNPLVTLTSGATTNLYGGGKAANVTGNPSVLVNGGTVSTGIYGGNNESGTVTGNTTITINGGTIGTSSSKANIHGGGFGQSTSVTGNVTVNFGEVIYDSDDEIHTAEPLLYGDIYGGSALGNVNTVDVNASNPTTTTTVNILNGRIEGDVYGGGLGRKDGVNGSGNIEAKVWGEVHVNIGAAPEPGESNPTGMASLVNSNVYGCNNFNGSPQQHVYVDVYKTNHTDTDLASYTEELNRTYAIQYVFGGGNQANYHPDVNLGLTKKTHNYVHTCDNTVEIVYGGGNAADCDGVELTIDGGRFNFIFGGGNGQVTPANVGEGSATITLKGGLVGWYFQGCNMQGTVGGDVHETQGCSGEDCCPTFSIEKYYFGANEATIYNGLDSEIKCEDASDFQFTYVYAGSRLATIYGDIKLTVKGGNIGNLFGGSEGSDLISADVKKYPANWDDINNFPTNHQQGLRNHLQAHPEDYGKGGNIYLTLEGGTITNVFGGGDERGEIEGEIIVTVDSTQVDCPLEINYIYGGNNLTEYRPIDPNIISPRVLLLHGHVNNDIYGGSRGDDLAPDTKGKITSNPKVVVGDLVSGHKALVKGDVYGGGSSAEVVGNTNVILKGKTIAGKSSTTLNHNVYGGGKRGTVTGNTDVLVANTTPILFFTQLHCIITVTNNGVPVSSGDEIPAGTVLNITVTPAQRYNFTGWEVTGGTVANENALTTTFTMGTSDAMLKANLVITHTLTLIANPTDGGSFTVNGEAYTGPVTLSEGSTATVVATPATGYTFSGWMVNGTGSSVSSSNNASTTFTMGAGHTILQASFTPTR